MATIGAAAATTTTAPSIYRFSKKDQASLAAFRKRFARISSFVICALRKEGSPIFKFITPRDDMAYAVQHKIMALMINPADAVFNYMRHRANDSFRVEVGFFFDVVRTWDATDTPKTEQLYLVLKKNAEHILEWTSKAIADIQRIKSELLIEMAEGDKTEATFLEVAEYYIVLSTLVDMRLFAKVWIAKKPACMA